MFRSLSVANVAIDACACRVRDLVWPAPGTNKGVLGVIARGEPPWLIDTETGKPIAVPQSKMCVGMAFRPVLKTEINGARNQECAIVYGDSANFVEFYDVALGDWLQPMPLARAQSVAYSQQGDKLAIGTSTGSVAVVELNDGHRRKERFLKPICKSAIVRLMFTGQGESLIALTAGGAIYCVNAETGESAKQVFVGAHEDLDFECWAHAVHDVGRIAVFAGSAYRATGKCNLWVTDLDKGVSVAIETGHSAYVRRVQFLRNLKVVVFGDKGAEVYDLKTRKRLRVNTLGDKLGTAYAAMEAGPLTFVVGTAPGGAVETGAGYRARIGETDVVESGGTFPVGNGEIASVHAAKVSA